jgi:GDPmannose 4,6-dehydratase
MSGPRGFFVKKALITGITGQDGSYLAELLLAKGYEVHGIVRRSSSFNTGRIDEIFQDPHADNRQLVLHYGDLMDSTALVNLLRNVEPDEVYNLGAQSHVRVSFDLPDYTAEATGVGAVRMLEALRANGMNAKFYQASSSEMFGASPPPQNEDTKFHPRSPYGCAKLFAYWSTVNYREAYGAFATNGILFNHESPRRGETFVTRKIAQAAARIAAGLQDSIYLGNLDAVRDWGYAPDFVEAMWLMMQHDTPEDFVVATGDPCTVGQFAEMAFARVGLDASKYIRHDDRYERPSEVDALIGDYSKAKRLLGWEPKVRVPELAQIMVDAEVRAIEAKMGTRSQSTANDADRRFGIRPMDAGGVRPADTEGASLAAFLKTP